MQSRYNWKISVGRVDSLIRPIVVNTHCECELAVCKVIRENIDAPSPPVEESEYQYFCHIIFSKGVFEFATVGNVD